MALFQNIVKSVTDASQTALQKTRNAADSARYASLISDEKLSMNDVLLQIGKQYYDLHKDAPEAEYEELFQKIAASQKKIQEYQQNLQALKNLTTCPACGQQVSKDSAFCPSCGTKMPTGSSEAVSPVPTCPHCGAHIAENSKFCTSCGKNIQEDLT